MKASDERPLISLLHAVTQRQRDALSDALTRRGFTDLALPAIRLFFQLAEEPRSVQGLAGLTGTTKQFCAREVGRLSEGGYLKLTTSKEDGRVTLVSLTPRGKKVLRATHQVKDELESKVAKCLGKANARQLKQYLELLEHD